MQRRRSPRRRPALWGIPVLALVILAMIGGVVAAALVRPTGTIFVAAHTPVTTDDQPSAPSEHPSASSAPSLAQREQALTATLTAMSATPGAPEFAIAITDHQTGESFTYSPDKPFQTASVVKVEILTEALLQARQNGATLTDDQQKLADTMIRQSDNGAASKLWSQIGDEDGLSAANTALGLTETVPGTNGYWGLTTTTVTDQTKLLDTIADPNGPLGDSNQVILDLMGSVEADQHWGVSAAAHPGESTILKNGWMAENDKEATGTWTINSVGRITGPGTDLTMTILSRSHANLDSGIAFVQNLAQLSRTQLGW
jgi:hypothetical protein